jgi:hypothetical protein
MQTSIVKSSSGTGLLLRSRFRRTDLGIAGGLGASLISMVVMGQMATETTGPQSQIFSGAFASGAVGIALCGLNIYESQESNGNESR